MNFTTRTDIIASYIKPSLGEFVDDYDVDAIADELLDAYHVTEWVWDGVHLRWEHPALADEVSGSDAFWAIVEKHDVSAQA